MSFDTFLGTGQVQKQAEMSDDDKRSILSDAVQRVYGRPSSMTSPVEVSPWVKEVFDDQVICEMAGRNWAIPYSIDVKGDVSLGDAEEVREVYRPVGKADGVNTFSPAQKDIPSYPNSGSDGEEAWGQPNGKGFHKPEPMQAEGMDMEYGKLQIHNSREAILKRLQSVGKCVAPGGCCKVEKVGGRFTDCMDRIAPAADVANPAGFCAWLHHEQTGSWPGEGK